MNRKIIYELERTREIMGLELEVQNILTEQGKVTAEFVDDILKIFSKSTTRKTAQLYAEKITSLIGKSSSKTLQNVVKRMLLPKNVVVDAGGKVISIVGSGGGEYSIKQIRTIMKRVANGTLKGDDLKYVLDQLPKELSDGSGFRASFTKQMKNVEKGLIEKVEKEALEKAEKEALEKAEKEAIEKAEKEAIEKAEKEAAEQAEKKISEESLEDLINQNIKQSGRGWLKDVKLRLRDLILGKNVDGDVSMLTNNALLKFLDKSGVKNMDDLAKLLREMQSQAQGGTLPETIKWAQGIDVDKYVKQIAAVLKENSERVARGESMIELPPGIIDDIQSLALVTNHRNLYMEGLNVSWVRRRIKDLNAAIRKTPSDANLIKERDDLLRSILGTKVDEAAIKNIGTFSAKINKGTIGGLGRWAIRDIKNIAKTLGFFTLTWGLNAIVNEFRDQFGGTKAIAGLTKKFYEKFRGHKWMIQAKGGLSDSNAKKGAALLKKYLRGWALIRDWAESSNFETRLSDICGEDEEYKNGGPKIKGTIMGCTEENKLRFWNETVDKDGDVADWSPWASADDVGVFKFITGTNDAAIINFYKKYVPSILAASQVTYFYEDDESYELLTDLNMMSSQLPVLGTIDNWLFKTKSNVMDVLNNQKPWVIGEGKAGDNFALAVTEITNNWPQFASTRKTKDGDEWYSGYQTGAAIPPARLAAITDENNYIAGSFDEDDVYKAPANFNLWLDNLTVEEFKDGFCAGIKSTCKPYVAVKPAPSSRLKGYDTAKIKTEVTTVLKRLVTEFQDSNIWNSWFTSEDAKSVRGEQVDVDLNIDESVNQKPVMEGLINILLGNLKK